MTNIRHPEGRAPLAKEDSGFDHSIGSIDMTETGSLSSLKMSQSMKSQFPATALWNDIIEHLKGNIDTKKRKGKHKKPCFSGSDAVSVILNFLQISGQINKEVGRENALKVCNSLLNVNVIESASKEKEFEDSCHKYYFFSDTDSSDFGSLLPPVTPFMRKRKLSGTLSEPEKHVYVNHGVQDSPDSDENTCPVKKTSNPLTRLTTAAVRRLVVGSPVYTSSPHPRPSRRHNLDSDRVEARELALRRLTQVLDLPLLDELLTLIDADDTPPLPADLPVKPPENLTSSHEQMSWLAAEILRLCSKSMNQSSDTGVMLDAVCTAVDRKQIQVFTATCAEPLRQCYELLESYKDKEALLVIQLLLLLIPTFSRHICCLLLQIISHCKATGKQSKLLLERLSVGIVGSQLRHDQASTIVRFMCEKRALLGSLSPRRMARQYSVPQITLSDKPDDILGGVRKYREQARVATERALRDMTEKLLNDPTKSMKDKQRHLTALNDNHPLVFSKYFANHTLRK